MVSCEVVGCRLRVVRNMVLDLLDLGMGLAGMNENDTPRDDWHDLDECHDWYVNA